MELGVLVWQPGSGASRPRRAMRQSGAEDGGVGRRELHLRRCPSWTFEGCSIDYDDITTIDWMLCVVLSLSVTLPM